MKLKMMVLTIFSICMSPSSYSEDNFSFIGLSSKGMPVEVLFKKNKWREKINKSIGVISQSTLRSLEKFEDKQLSFNFDQVDVGSYIKMSLGLGDIVKGTIEPYFKLFFKKNKTHKAIN